MPIWKLYLICSFPKISTNTLNLRSYWRENRKEKPRFPDFLLFLPFVDFTEKRKREMYQRQKYSNRFPFRSSLDPSSHCSPFLRGLGGSGLLMQRTNIPIRKTASEVDFPYCCSRYLGMKNIILTNALNCITLTSMKSM